MIKSIYIVLTAICLTLSCNSLAATTLTVTKTNDNTIHSKDTPKASSGVCTDDGINTSDDIVNCKPSKKDSIPWAPW